MKNILITIISPWDQNKKLCKYNAHEYGEVEASLASEACCKYVIKKLDSENKKLDNAICLVSTQAKAGYEHFCEEFKESNIQVEECKISDECIENNEYSEPLDEVVTRVKKIAEDDKKIVIHFDLAGGLRNISVLIEQLTKFFKYYGYEIESYYTYYVNTDQSKNTFFDCKNLYKQIDILDGVNEFVTRGSAKKLQECYENVNDEDVKELLKHMGRFNDEIELCRVDNLNKTLNGMNNALKSLKENESNGENVFLLRQMIPLIEKKFYGGEEIDYLSTIRWCLDNGLIQQALTIYVEKVPEYLFKKKILEVDESSDLYKNTKKEVENNPTKSDVYSTLFYEKIQEKSYSTKFQKEIDKCFFKHKKKMGANGNQYDELIVKACDDAKWRNIRDKEVRDLIKELSSIQDNNKPAKFSKEIDKDTQEKIDRIEIKEGKSPENFEQLIRKLLNHEGQLYNWLYNGNDTYMKKIIIAEHFDKNNKNADMKYNVDCKYIQEIYSDYIYVKAVRNRTNHASDEANLSDGTKDFLYNKYLDIDGLTPTDIADKLLEFVKRIKEAESTIAQ